MLMGNLVKLKGEKINLLGKYMENKKIKNQRNQLIIYQAKSGAIEFRGDFRHETIWAARRQIADIFEIDRSVVTKHIRNIFKDKELDKKMVCAKFAHTTQHGAIKGKTQTKQVEFYNLDIILAVGYRTNSTKAIEFRKWATRVLKQHILEGYTINKKRVNYNYENFMRAVTDVKTFLPIGNKARTEDILELISAFANTWISLEAYDKDIFPKTGATKKKISVTAEELLQTLTELKKELIARRQATDIFGQERSKNVVQGIVGNVFQATFGKDVYPSTEEKSAHLLYFMVKNHPFVDGNKRSGAFAFVWFLRKSGLLNASLTPEALTALTLLIAESRPKDKDKMTGLVLLLLRKKTIPTKTN